MRGSVRCRRAFGPCIEDAGEAPAVPGGNAGSVEPGGAHLRPIRRDRQQRWRSEHDALQTAGSMARLPLDGSLAVAGYGSWNSALMFTLLDGIVNPQWVTGFEL
jgi:hypothetical protein